MVNAQELKGNSAAETSNQKQIQEIMEVSKVLSIISKFDALILLSKAKDGMESAFVMYSKIGLTRKNTTLG